MMLSDKKPPTVLSEGERSIGGKQSWPCAVMRWVALVLLAGYLVFAHGCHGDEDDELFTSMVTSVFTSGEQ